MVDFVKLLHEAEQERRATWNDHPQLPTDCGYVMEIRCLECGLHAFQMTQDPKLAGTTEQIRCSGCQWNHNEPRMMD